MGCCALERIVESFTNTHSLRTELWLKWGNNELSGKTSEVSTEESLSIRSKIQFISPWSVRISDSVNCNLERSASFDMSRVETDMW